MTTKDLLIAIKIKQEKVDPEVENKINSIAIKIKEEPDKRNDSNESFNSNDTYVAEASQAEDDKKSIEPVKSSNEILAELFKVFNAEPPKELLDDDNLIKKVHRHKKHKKEKKKKHKKGIFARLDGGNGELEASDNQATDKDSENERKTRKKKKKEKHKLKEKPTYKVRQKESSKYNGKGKTELTLSSKCENNQLDRKSLLSNVSIKLETVDKHKVVFRSSDKRKDGHISEISLSDEETYLKERERTSGTGRKHYDRDFRQMHENFFYGNTKSRGREYRERQNRESRQKFGKHSKSRSRSRSRSRDLKIDKKRLLEIARKNAISMFKRGSLPGSAGMSEEVKDKVLLKMRYGGRTVQDLTDFCKKISIGEHLSDLSSDEDSDVDKSGNAKAFHHPFLLKEREPIVMHIRNSKPILPRAIDDTAKTITMQFPVSSGVQHRLTEGWIPVEPRDSVTPLQPLPPAAQSTNIFKGKNTPKNVFEKPIPKNEKQEPAFKSLDDELQLSNDSNDHVSATIPDTNINSKIVPAPCNDSSNTSTAVQPPFVPDVPIPSTNAPIKNIFSSHSTLPVDVSSIISKRLNAMRRLQDNPMDSEALKMMHNSQQEMSTWVSSKHTPGQFTGSTGANVLKAHELNTGPQLWARRDQLTSTQPVTGGMGMHLLQKMGWKPGEGLGREKTGSLQPLLLDVKLDKRGLVSKEDNAYQRPQPPVKKPRGNAVAKAQQNIQEKHPVCLLNEMTSKRKWTPPLYTLINEYGPSHNKLFLFSVSINGQTFTANQASNTKKEAKLVAARHCLQQIGILP